MVLICISLMTGDIDHLFLYTLALCILSVEKCLFQLFAHGQPVLEGKEDIVPIAREVEPWWATEYLLVWSSVYI